MKVAEFLLGFIPLLIQLYADSYRQIDLENTKIELESEFNVSKTKAYDFIIVIRYANVSEILLDNGVAYMRHGFLQIAHAQKEIAGTYSSPLLLMKSGIGPESVLNAADIPVKVPLEAVGKNLVDHLGMWVSGFQ